jgi:hypothetical protein
MCLGSNLLILVLSFRGRGSYCEASGVLLNPHLAMDLSVDKTWTLWASSSGQRSVSCRLAAVDSIGSGIGSQGEHITLIGDQEYRADPQQDLFQAAMNHIEVDVDPPLSGEDCPLFLAPVRGWKPRQVKALLRIKAANVSELPDFQSCLAWRREFDRGDPFLSAATLELHSSRFLQRARACMTTICRWIPFGSDWLNGNCGVIEVVNEVGAEQILATLHLPNDLSSICAGTLLTRGATWIEDGQQQRSHAEIAEIIELLD